MDRHVIARCLLICFVCSVCSEVSSAAVEATKSEGTTQKANSKSRTGVPGLHNDALVYPSDLEQNGTLNRGGISETPLSSKNANPSPCLHGAVFCELADDYPKDIIKTKLKKQPKLLLDILYDEDVLEDKINKFDPEGANEKELCTSQPSIVYPNKGKSKEGLYEFIVNDEEHKQGVRVETCTNNGGECNELPALILPLAYRSKCVQKYILRTLVVLNRNDTSDVQGFVTKPFEFPSCCSCVIVMSVPGYDRFGPDDNTTPVNVTATARTTNSPVKEKPNMLN